MSAPEPKLLPCPFCGHPAEFNEDEGFVDAECASPACHASRGLCMNKDAAAAAWNRRTPSPEAIAKLIAAADALREFLEGVQPKFNSTFERMNRLLAAYDAARKGL